MKAPTTTEKNEMDGRERVYKVVRYGYRGTGTYSALAGKYGGTNTKEATRLQYGIGKLTLDTADGEGIYIYLDKDYAIDQAKKMAEKTDRKMAVFSAKPLGDIVIPAGKSKTATCDGLMLIESVWSQAPKPKETWEDITASLTCRRDGVMTDGRWAFAKPTAWVAVGGLPSTYKVEINGTQVKVLRRKS